MANSSNKTHPSKGRGNYCKFYWNSFEVPLQMMSNQEKGEIRAVLLSSSLFQMEKIKFRKLDKHFCMSDLILVKLIG
jgi:hypothetical protein